MAFAFVLILLAAGLALLTAGMQARKQRSSRYQNIKMIWLFATSAAFLLIGFLAAIMLLTGNAPQT